MPGRSAAATEPYPRRESRRRTSSGLCEFALRALRRVSIRPDDRPSYFTSDCHRNTYVTMCRDFTSRNDVCLSDGVRAPDSPSALSPCGATPNPFTGKACVRKLRGVRGLALPVSGRPFSAHRLGGASGRRRVDSGGRVVTGSSVAGRVPGVGAPMCRSFAESVSETVGGSDSLASSFLVIGSGQGGYRGQGVVHAFDSVNG